MKQKKFSQMLSRRTAALVLLSSPTVLRAQPATVPERGANPHTPATDQAEYDSRADLQVVIQNYIERWTSRNRSNEPGLLIESDIKPVPLRPDHPEWIKARTLTFEQAVLAAQQKFVIAQGLTNTSEAIAGLFRAGNQDPPPFRSENLDQPGALPDLARRILAVARGRLDNELRELGIDPVELSRVPEPQRHIQAANRLRISSVERAFGELVGFSPIQTFEAHDGQGNFYIGVVLAGSHRRKAMAAQILSQRGQFQPNPDPAFRTPIRSLVANRNALVDDFGVRLLDDDNGLPILVSFAQWGMSYVGRDRMRSELERDAAEAQARSLADRQIAEFLAANAEFRTNNRVEGNREVAVQINAANQAGQELATFTVADMVQQVIRRQARINNLPGIYTLSNWTALHPETNQPIIGCVRAWSAVSETAMREYRIPTSQVPPEAPRAPQQSGRPGIRMGREIIGGRDF